MKHLALLILTTIGFTAFGQKSEELIPKEAVTVLSLNNLSIENADKEVIDFMKHNSRSLIFSASMTPASVAAALAALNIMVREPERIQHLWDVTNYAKKKFDENGFL